MLIMIVDFSHKCMQVLEGVILGKNIVPETDFSDWPETANIHSQRSISFSPDP